ncbi:MAG: hypothetical protein N2314_07415 [Brevinematales bacterium]|nr:hypothetical protein [Brevinematales bacterium]
MRKLLLFCLFFPASFLANTNVAGHCLAVDLGWTTEGIVNQGIGWGILLDLSFSPHLYARLRHGVVETDKAIVGKRVGNYVSSLLVGYRPWGDSRAWFSGIYIATGFGYDQVITADPVSGAVADHFLLPFADFSLGYRFLIGRVVIEPYVSILLPFVEPERSKTGIAMYTRHVDLEGISIGILF